MKLRMLKDWSYNRAGDIVDVFEPTAKEWVREGIATPVTTESRSIQVEQATMHVDKKRPVRQ